MILKDIETNGAWSGTAVDRGIRKEGASSPAFIRELVYGVERNLSLLDFNIDGFLKKPGVGIAERIWLRMGFYQLSEMDGVADYAAVNETVELARSFKKGSESFINAVLRNFQRSGGKLKTPSEKDPEYLSVRYSVHPGIAKLWLGIYGSEKTEELLRISNTPSPLCIRTDLLRIGREQLKEKLISLGFSAEEGSLSPAALYVKGSGLLDTDAYREGLFSVQGEASQYAAGLLSPREGSTVIDLCAAPGGKSCAMAERMKNKGRIIAFDIYEHRIKLIEKEAERLGIGIIETEAGDSSVFDGELEGIADFVLADVPCSGLGTLRENPEIKYRSPGKPESQDAILENALRYLRPGGKALYSTCTVSPEENGDVVRNCRLVDSRIIGGRGDGDCRYRVTAERQLLPEEGGHGGFYLCLIQRVK